ncbi:unnamed protein product [Eruca vesicaria subsp. sativa]|uniref:Uncharacterized protein n=1 Tax=Eruca vesicaria subsp. sativa TaxID=29727 RepID=A0ABC8KQR3_ERUVS|nr:unnamed protein product [Eruca vesicaria subsp. sativa]
MVHGVDGEKVADHLDRAVSSLGRHPLKVLVQVNTSGEASKSGVEPSSVLELARHVNMHCPNLVFSGLITIGMPDYTSTPENFRVCSSSTLNLLSESLSWNDILLPGFMEDNDVVKGEGEAESKGA